MGLSVRGLTVAYDGAVALRDVSLDVERAEVVAVVGPSGSGKSTLLRAITGLEPSRGEVAWDGEDLSGVAPHRRRFGLMFQEHALFPHRNVAGNIAFGPRMQGWDAARVRLRTEEVLALVSLPGFGARAVNELSGGEQQRVSLARALAPMPRVLLLDEPLGSLDRPLRERLTVDLRTLVIEQGVAALYVTHDHHEARAVADRVVVLSEGQVVQSGTPSEVWSRPATAWVAGFLGVGEGAEAERTD